MPNTQPRVLPDLLLTEEELAVVLKCSRTTAVKYVNEGIIPSVKVGYLRRVRLSDLTSYLEALEPDRGPTSGEWAA